MKHDAVLSEHVFEAMDLLEFRITWRIDIKNYIYISESKISYLLPQTQSNKGWLKRLKLGLSIDVSGLKSEVSANPANSETTVDKLGQLVSHIQKNEIGKGSWEQFTMTVSQVHLFDPENEFFLVGRIGPKPETSNERNSPGVFVLLCGNARHLVGNANVSSKTLATNSYYPYVANSLLEWSDSEKLLVQDGKPKIIDREVRGYISDVPTFFPGCRNSEVASVIEGLQKNAVGPTFEVEFLALKLFEFHDKYESQSYIYSPLYVAQV